VAHQLSRKKNEDKKSSVNEIARQPADYLLTTIVKCASGDHVPDDDTLDGAL
jgi:hypothetical protein